MGQVDGSNSSLRKRVMALEAANHDLESELKATRSSFQLLRGEFNRLRSSALAPQVSSPSLTPAAKGETPLSTRLNNEPKRKADIKLPPYTDGGETEKAFRQALQGTGKDAREARKCHNSLFRFLIMNQYKSTSLLEDMKLPPIAGATKAAIDRFNSGDHFYMEWDVVTAMIRIVRDYFPHSFKDDREARKKLNYLIDNFKAKLDDETPQPLEIIFSSPPPPQPTIPYGAASTPTMQPIRDISAVTLNMTAVQSDSSFDDTPNSSILDRLFR